MTTPFGSYPFDAAGVDNFSHPLFINAERAPTTQDLQPAGTRWLDGSVSPKVVYTTVGGGVWQEGGNAIATTTTYGIIKLNEDDTMATASDDDVATSLTMKTYVDSVAIAGAPDASESQKGIAELANTAEAQAGVDDTRIMTAAKVVDLLETPPAIGGTTPAAGSFTTLGATGAVDFDAGGSWESGGATLSIAADNNTDAVNFGTTGARTITIGNATGATTVDINAGTSGIICDSTGAISLDAAAASNFSTSGAGIDLTLESAAGRVIVNGGEDAADVIYLHTCGS